MSSAWDPKHHTGAWLRCGIFRVLLLAVAVVGSAPPARASLSILVGEPFGSWGTVMPLGHTAIFLDHVCAEGPLHLRPCKLGEAPGVVLARYHAIGQYDWLASPVLDFLFAAETPADIPTYATPDTVWALRQRFRERFLRTVVPDGTEGHEIGDGRAEGAGSVEEWWESVGAAFNRRIWAYQITTTPDEDQALIRYLNASSNRHRYHLRKTNCADFAAELVNVIHPAAIHNDRIADFGLMTPKEVARSLVEYASKRPHLNLRIWQIPQLPGSLPRSRPIRGGAESGLKTKRYLLPLLVIQPEVPAYLATIYLWHGRWFVGTGAAVLPLHTLPPADISPVGPAIELAETPPPFTATPTSGALRPSPSLANTSNPAGPTITLPAITGSAATPTSALR